MKHKTSLIFPIILFILLSTTASAASLEEWIGTYLNEFLGNLINGLFYPFRLIFYHISLFITELLSPFFNLITSIYSIFNAFYNMFTDFAGRILPIDWLILFSCGILIRFFKAIYSYLKDIEIGGFKI